MIEESIIFYGKVSISNYFPQDTFLNNIIHFDKPIIRI